MEILGGSLGPVDGISRNQSGAGDAGATAGTGSRR